MQDLFTKFKDSIQIDEISSEVKMCTTSIDRVASIILKNGEEYLSKQNIPFDDYCHIVESFGLKVAEKARNFRTLKRQIEWLSGRISIYVLIENFLSSDYYNFNIKTDQRGAPFIEESPVQISITHSGKYASAGIALNKNFSLGIDMEEVKIINDRANFLRVGFSDKELDYCALLSDIKILENWTIKESFLKILKIGFGENLKKVQIFNDRIYYNDKEVFGFRKNVKVFNGHILTALYGEKDNNILI